MCSASFAFGQSGSDQETFKIRLEPVVITGSSLPPDLHRKPLSVTTITPERIEEKQPASAADLLREVPGLHIDQPGGRGGVSSVYIRGSDPNYTVVLVDGVKVNDPTNSRGGSFDFSSLNPENIERIEIVPGPLSSIYGSDALGGVIQIFTKQPTDQPVTSIKMRGGRFGDYHASLETRGKLKGIGYSLSSSYIDAGKLIEGSDFRNLTLNGSFSVEQSDTTAIRSVIRYTDNHTEGFPEDSGGPQYAVSREVEQRDAGELSVGINLSHDIFPTWQTLVHFSYFNRDGSLDFPGIAPGVRDPLGIPPNAADSHYRVISARIGNLIFLTDRAQLMVGIEGQMEWGSSYGSLFLGAGEIPTSFELDRSLWAPFIEVQQTLSMGLVLQGSVRLDVPRVFSPEMSPRIALSYRAPSKKTSLYAAWGKGFKLPSFFALGHPIVGNLNLAPEKGWSGEVSATRSIWRNRIQIGGTLFTSRYRNTIDFDEGPPPSLVNRSTITTRGLTLHMTKRPYPNLQTKSHLTYLKTDIEDITEELRNRPKWRGGLTLIWGLVSSYKINMDLLYVGKVLDSAIPTGDRYLDPYILINAAMIWTPTPNWEAFIAIDNLLNSSYQEMIGFPAPGINPRFGLRANL